VFAAGDVARWPHPLFGAEPLRMEHWGNAVSQARTAAHNMVHGDHRRHDELPAFWSDQFGLNLKSVGFPSLGTEVSITQGSTSSRKFVVTYGRGGRMVAAVAVNMPRVLPGYASMTCGRPVP
jgi:3-phenylpropionate/trans-cinnamate dioxygenase ferredoxin reductase subunit